MNQEYEYEYEYDPMDDVKQHHRHLGQCPEGIVKESGFDRYVVPLEVGPSPVRHVTSQMFDYTDQKKDEPGKPLFYGRIYSNTINNIATWGFKTPSEFKKHLARDDKKYAMDRWQQDLAIDPAICGNFLPKTFWVAKNEQTETHPGWWAISIEGIKLVEDTLIRNPNSRFIVIFADGGLTLHNARSYVKTNTITFKEDK